MSVQQDAVGASRPELYGERGLMAVLSDGIGGMQAGERFSAIAVRRMLDYHAACDPGGDPCRLLEDACRAARQEAVALARDEKIEGGATVAAVMIRENACAFLSLGDSRIYLMRGGGLIQLNREQTLGPELDARAALGLTLREEARHNRYRASLVNNLCEPGAPPPDMCPRPFGIVPGDRLALVSDGIYKVLGDADIARALKSPGADGATRLIRAVEARDLPKQDNYSAIVVAVLGDERQNG